MKQGMISLLTLLILPSSLYAETKKQRHLLTPTSLFSTTKKNEANSFIPKHIELSGLGVLGEDDTFLYGVSDEEAAIYQIDMSNGSYEKRWEVVKSDGTALKKPDFEGIDVCSRNNETVFYIVDEKKHKLYIGHLKEGKVVLDKPIWINFSDADKGTNTGIEAIAMDCVNNLAYVSIETGQDEDPPSENSVLRKHRPRLGIIDLNQDLREDEQRKTAALEEIELKTDTVDETINWIADVNFQGKGLDQDISDMDFYRGHLYLLRRNTREIVRMKKQKPGKIDKVWSYVAHAPIYQKKKGLAEAMVVNGQGSFILGYDSSDYSKHPLSTEVAATYNLETGNPEIYQLIKDVYNQQGDLIIEFSAN